MIKNLANLITVARVLLTTIIIIFLKTTPIFQKIAIFLIPVAMIFDMFDGMAARRTNTHSINGSVYDILADRMIEFAFFIFFAVNHVCNIWAALIIIWRGLMLDAIRSIALRYDKTAFGASSLHKKSWTKLLVSSRFSRGTYNTLKTITFILMALQLYQPYFSIIVQPIVWITVLWALVRAVPVLIDGYALIRL